MQIDYDNFFKRIKFSKYVEIFFREINYGNSKPSELTDTDNIHFIIYVINKINNDDLSMIHHYLLLFTGLEIYVDDYGYYIVDKLCNFPGLINRELLDFLNKNISFIDNRCRIEILNKIINFDETNFLEYKQSIEEIFLAYRKSKMTCAGKEFV